MSELVQSISITNLINQREAIRARLEVARKALAEADDIVNAISEATERHRFYGGAAALVMTRGSVHDLYIMAPDGITKGMRTFDAMAWQHLMQESGLRSLMDATARAEWDKTIEKGEFPDLTADNIRATFARLHEARGDMFERGVIEAFRRLSWHYATNLPQKFGRRIVITHLTGWHHYQKCDQVDDLQRVLHILDGKPEPDLRNSGTYKALSKAGLFGMKRAGLVETEYLSIKAYKNGNAHITFKRPDLVDRMNLIIAKHYPGALPAPK